MTINTLFLMCFLQGYEQLPHQDDVAGVGTVGAATARHVGVIHAGIEQDGLQGGCQFFRGVVRHHAFEHGHVVLCLHGSVLLCVGFCFGKPDGKLAVFILCADFQTAALKACLSLFHTEQFRIHVPLFVHIHERVRIVCFQSENGVHGLSELLAVNGAAYPFLPTEKECAVIAYHQLATGNTVEKVIHCPCVFGTEPLEKSPCHTSIGSPCSLLVWIISSFSCYNRLKISRREDSPHRCLSLLLFKKLLLDFTLCDTQILFDTFLFSPFPNIFPELLCDTCKVNPALVTVTLKDQVFSVHFCEFNQILIREHNYKNCDKKKSPRRCALHIYAGRMMQPIVSARPP